MKIKVRVTPRSSQNKIVQAGDIYKIYVHESATDGKANKAVIAIIADHFKIKKSMVRIIQGSTNRNKLILIETRKNGDG
jgi:uncharacterized protein